MTTQDAIPKALPEWLDLTQHAVFLDFDGTLVPIVARPQDVWLADESRQMLERLIAATGGAVAMISGRGIADLQSHLRDLPVALSGSHGLEFALPGAAVSAASGDAPALDATLADLGPLAGSEALLLERKPGAVALHYRNRPDLAETCRSAVARAAETHKLRCLHGNMVSEAVLPGVDKGTALRRFMEHPPFKDRIPLMIGDDTTDEDGFAAAQALGGCGLRIGGTDSCAQYRVATMQQALSWLSRLVIPRR